MMNAQKTKSLTVVASLLFTFAAGAPAIADDTELLIVDPTLTVATSPNILFILDTSGSMRDPESTTEPYDSTRPTPYPGDCDPNSVYWTKLDVTPSCPDPAGAGSNQVISKSAFVCNDALLRMSGIGAYTGVMAQHYSADGTSPARWQEIEMGNTSSSVECQDDAGLHGNGTTSNFFAQAGSGLAEFTNDADAAVPWGSGDVAQVYTVYDGNYLNWRENPVTVSLPKIDIMKAVTKNVMNSISDVNVGVMRFNDNQGGRILHAVSDIDTNRSSIVATIDSLAAGGSTPLAESLYESALYWRGMTAAFGSSDDASDVDPAAFSAGSPGDYQQPPMPVCTRNFNVLLSDGRPNDDDQAQPLAPALPSFGTLGRTACDDDVEDGHCLDDISEYLSEVDISTGTTGAQTVTTHTIGFAVDLPILEETANISGGDYYLADDVETLTRALRRIVEGALDKGLSFAAPAVAVNSFNRTQNFNDLYISTFIPDNKVHWPGNLKKYSIDDGVIKDARSPAQAAIDADTGFFDEDARSFWTDAGITDGDSVVLGGAANRLPDPSVRNVFTNLGSSDDLDNGSNAVVGTNLSLTATDFGLTGALGEPTLDEVIRWTRGEDVLDVDGDPATTVRFSMGDPLHSQPAAVVYGDAADPEVVVFTATNDGYFHAIDGDTGDELWTFIPKQLLPDLPELMLNGASTFKHYGIDGDIVPVVSDENKNGLIDGDDFVYVIFGMRRGGSDYFALDVTDKDDPQLLWQKTFPEFGQSWSRPVVARVDFEDGVIDTDVNPDEAVVIIGEGYDTVHDSAALPATADNVGAGITMLDLVTGERVWRAGRADANLTLSQLTRSIPSEVRVIDFTGDGFVDRMYAIDVGGQLFRFDVFRDQSPANTVTGGVIARFGGEGVATAGATNTRRFYSPPDVSIFADPVLNRRLLAVGVGSGYRAHPLDTSATDVYYSLRDADIFAKLPQSAYDLYDVAIDTDMREVSGQVGTIIGPSDRGWKFTMPVGQMILSASATFDNSVFFLGFSPDALAAASCNVRPGTNFLYQVNIANGDPVANNLDTLAASESDAARRTMLEQGGIAPTPAFLFPSAADSCTGAACSPPPVGCVGVECFDPGFANNPVRTLWTQDGIE